MGILNRKSIASRTLAILLAVLMLAWAGLLWHARKTPLDYVIAKAGRATVVPACEWVGVDAPAIASLGLDTADPAGWTTRKTAYLAFRTAQHGSLHLDLGVVAVAVDGVTVSADGGTPQVMPRIPLPSGMVVHLPLSALMPDGLHLVKIEVPDPKPPSGHDLRWLGIAVANMRVCDSSQSLRG